MKPEVVLYGEGLDMEVMQRSVDHIANADLLIVGGTSLVVLPGRRFGCAISAVPIWC